jgi:hypothetical protein
MSVLHKIVGHGSRYPKLRDLTLATALAMAGQAQAATIEVAIKQTVLSDGAFRYSIPVSIGNETVDAMLDTGSTGLRLLPGAVTVSNFTSTDRPNQYGYGSGVKLTGTIANTVLKIGGVPTSESIPIQIIQTIGCYENMPKCPASRVSPRDYGLGGDGLAKQGFPAIIGVRMPAPGQVRQAVVNPLMFIGSRSWVIVLPLPGQGAQGKLILNPDQTDLAGYTYFPIPKDDAIPGCLRNDDTRRTFCGPVKLDSGTPHISVNTSSVIAPFPWPDGTRGTFTFRGSDTAELHAQFAVAPGRPSHVTLMPLQSQQSNSILAGVLPYFFFSVHYDYGNGAIGLKPRK